MRSLRILAAIAGLVIVVGLLLPIYTVALRFPLQGLGEFNYEIGYSLLGATTKSSISLDNPLPFDVEKYSMEADGSTTLKELLGESGLPDVKRMAQEAGFPVDVSMLPVDIDSLSNIAGAASTTSEIPLLSSESDLQSYIPSLPGQLSTIPLAEVISLGLRFGPLIFLIPPFIGIAQGRYGKAASTFIILLILPLTIPFFTPFMRISMNIGWYVMLFGSLLLITASIIQRRERSVEKRQAPEPASNMALTRN